MKISESTVVVVVNSPLSAKIGRSELPWFLTYEFNESSDVWTNLNSEDMGDKLAFSTSSLLAIQRENGALS